MPHRAIIRRIALATLAAIGLCAPTLAAPKRKNPRLLDSVDDWGRPWVDCTFSLYKRLAAYRAQLKAKGQLPPTLEFALGTDIALRKVFKNKAWFKGEFTTQVAISAAKG